MAKAIDKQYLIDSLKGFDSNILEPKYTNVIEDVKVNNVSLTVTDKSVNVEIPDGVEYKLAAQSTPESGYFATYTLQANTGAGGTYEDVDGAKINIPKDFLVRSASLNTVTAADKASGGKFENDTDFAEGDKYIDLEINTIDATSPLTDSTHLYINVSTLVDTYTAGDGIDVDSSTNEISVDAKANGGLIADDTGLYIEFEDVAIDFATEYSV